MELMMSQAFGYLCEELSLKREKSFQTSSGVAQRYVDRRRKKLYCDHLIQQIKSTGCMSIRESSWEMRMYPVTDDLKEFAIQEILKFRRSKDMKMVLGKVLEGDTIYTYLLSIGDQGVCFTIDFDGVYSDDRIQGHYYSTHEIMYGFSIVKHYRDQQIQSRKESSKVKKIR